MDELKLRILSFFETKDQELSIGDVYNHMMDEDPNDVQKAFWGLVDDNDIQMTAKKTFKRTR